MRLWQKSEELFKVIKKILKKRLIFLDVILKIKKKKLILNNSFKLNFLAKEVLSVKFMIYVKNLK